MYYPSIYLKRPSVRAEFQMSRPEYEVRVKSVISDETENLFLIMHSI